MKVINRNVAMICWFNTSGEISLVRFRIEDDEGQYQVFKINRYRYDGDIREEGRVFKKYTCKVEINNIEKICEIRFYKNELKWVLWKI